MKPFSINSAQIQLYGHHDANSFQKIFPQEYIKKFASHLKILQFEKKLFQNVPSPGKLKFTKRLSLFQNLKVQETKLKTNLSKFAKINDTIIHDKAQIVRFKEIAKQVTSNIDNHQLKSKLVKQKFSNNIKTINNKEQVQMKVIDNMLIQSTRQTNEKINEKLQKIKNKQIFCKFTKRDPQRQGKNSYKSNLQWASMKRYNSEKQMKGYSKNKYDFQISKRLQHKSSSLHQLSKQKQSILFKPSFNQNNDEIKKSPKFALLSPFDSSKRNRIKSSSKMVSVQKVLNKKDLIQQTQRLKDNKNKLKSILYSNEVGKKDWQKVVQNILNKNQLNSSHNNGFSTNQY